LFLSVKLRTILLSPTTTFPKATDVAESVVGAMPVPVSATERDWLGFAVAILSEPVATGPREEGVRVRATVQDAPPASVAPHVVEGSTAYPPAGAVIEPIPNVRGASWLFLSVKVRIILLSPTTTFPKATDIAESVVGAIPVPVNVTGDSTLGAVVVMVSDPGVTTPTLPGVSVSPIVQLAL
jgi:hypothetical protein